MRLGCERELGTRLGFKGFREVHGNETIRFERELRTRLGCDEGLGMRPGLGG